MKPYLLALPLALLSFAPATSHANVIAKTAAGVILGLGALHAGHYIANHMHYCEFAQPVAVEQTAIVYESSASGYRMQLDVGNPVVVINGNAHQRGGGNGHMNGPTRRR